MTSEPYAGAAMREAWSRIARGFEDALDVPGIPSGERDRIVRCLTRARRLSGQRHLTVADRGNVVALEVK